MPDKKTDKKTKKGATGTGTETPAIVVEQHITSTLEENFMPYAMSVIVSRAIPEIDGFKPSHRKLLYTMYKMGLLTGARRKSADVVGRTMELNPHGDGAIYETMVRLTRGNDALLHPFIDSKGNFGKQYSRDMAYAASRYTEVRLDAICQELFRDIDKETVDMVPNYNGHTVEPVLFPTTFPNVLVTANQGIAVGMASAIASFNLREVCNAAIAYIKNPQVDLQTFMPGPDFSTGGSIIYNEKEMESVYETGRGSIKLRAKYNFDKKNSCIEVYEIPYTATAELIIDKIITLVKSNKIKDINDVRDETDLNGLKIAIDIKKSANPDHLMHRLFALTPLSDSFSCNFNILIDGRPKTMGVREILAEWLAFRVGCIRRQIRFDVQKKQEKLHLLMGLAKIMLDIDKAIHIIRETEEDNRVIPNLMEGFAIDQLQAEFIAEIKLRNLNREYLLNRVNERQKLEEEIAGLQDTLAHEEKIHGIISRELKEVAKKYGKDRRTDIVYEHEVEEIPAETFIEDYGVRLFLTAHNYFKKIPLNSLRSASDQNLKDDDRIIQEIETTNKAEILFFSNKYCAYKAKAHELADAKASGLGEYLNNLLGMDEDEKIVFIAATTNYQGHLFLAFENGKCAKVTLESYATKTNRKRLLNAYYDKSPLIFADVCLADRDYIAVRDSDRAMVFSSALVPVKTTKNTQGVQVYTLKKNSRLTACLPVEQFVTDDPGYYRSDKIPGAGHFIPEKDRIANTFLQAQLTLGNAD